MTTFALVHGAFHGAWCWDLVRPELESRGHRTVAMDLPCDDPGAGSARYAEVVAEAIRDEGDDVIVVGHSLAGLTVPLVAATRPVARIFLAVDCIQTTPERLPEPVFETLAGVRLPCLVLDVRPASAVQTLALAIDRL